MVVAGCSSVAELTVTERVAPSGERVLVGQAEPRRDNACTQVHHEIRDWGFRQRAATPVAMRRIEDDAVVTAASRGANFAQIVIPGEASVMGFDVNALKDAQVKYYRCADLSSWTGN